jgi:hypothetical protein
MSHHFNLMDTGSLRRVGYIGGRLIKKDGS